MEQRCYFTKKEFEKKTLPTMPTGLVTPHCAGLVRSRSHTSTSVHGARDSEDTNNICFMCHKCHPL